MKKYDRNVVVLVNSDDLDSVLQAQTAGAYLTTHCREDDIFPFYCCLDGLGSDLAVHFIDKDSVGDMTIRDCTSAYNHFTQITSYRRQGCSDDKDYLVVYSYADTCEPTNRDAQPVNWFFMAGYYSSGNTRPKHFIPTDIRVRGKTADGFDLVRLNHNDAADVKQGLTYIADLICAQLHGRKPESIANHTATHRSHFFPSPSL